MIFINTTSYFKRLLSLIYNTQQNSNKNKNQIFRNAKVYYSHEEIKKAIIQIMQEMYVNRRSLSPVSLYYKFKVRQPDLFYPTEIYNKTLDFFNDLKIQTADIDSVNGIERRTLTTTTFYNMCKELKEEKKIKGVEIKVRKNKTRIVYQLLDPSYNLNLA